MSKINIKKDLIKKIGQCKQCQLCNKLFSTEYKAIDHILEDHTDIESEAVEEIVKRSQTSKRSKRT